MPMKAGTRLQCGTCGSQIIVVKPGEADLVCCGQPLGPMGAPGGAGKAADTKPS